MVFSREGGAWMGVEKMAGQGELHLGQGSCNLLVFRV